MMGSVMADAAGEYPAVGRKGGLPSLSGPAEPPRRGAAEPIRRRAKVRAPPGTAGGGRRQDQEGTVTKPWGRLARGAVLAWGVALAGCAGAPAPLAYTYPTKLPAVYAPDAAIGAVAFRNGDRIELFLPNFHGDTRRRPERFSFAPVHGVDGTWLGHPYRLPRQADIVARAVVGRAVFRDDRSGREVAFLPPGALEVVFPDNPAYRTMAGKTVFLVPVGLGTRNTEPPEAARTAWRAPR